MTKKELIDALNEFVKSDRVKAVLETLTETHCSGWEAWIQIEFAYFLSRKATSVKEFKWWREYKIHTVTKNDGCNEYIIPDFWILDTETEADPESYYLIEFKRNNDGEVLKEMEKDVDKWMKHTPVYKDKLTCPNFDTTYHNSGIFFVGIDLKRNNTPTKHEFSELPLSPGFYYNCFLEPKDSKLQVINNVL